MMRRREGSETETPKRNSKKTVETLQLISNRDTFIMVSCCRLICVCFFSFSKFQETTATPQLQTLRLLNPDTPQLTHIGPFSSVFSLCLCRALKPKGSTLVTMNQLLTMSIGGSSYYQQVNASEAERVRKVARSVDLDLNNPPPSEIVALAGPSGVQSQQHSSDSPDDECLIISPGKFEEAVNNSQRNLSRRVRSNIEDFTEVRGAQSFDFLSADFFTWGFAFGRLQTVDGVVPLNDEVLNKMKDIATSIPVTPIEPPGEPEAPALSCAICMGQLVEETSTKCGHIFCKTCIEKAIATQHKCPNCRRKLRKRDIFRVHLPYTS